MSKFPDQTRPMRGPDGGFLATLGHAVRIAREERGLARKALAETADVSERYLAQLESGRGNASITLLRRLASALNLRLADLMSWEVSEKRLRLNRFLDGLSERRLDEVMQRLIAEYGSDTSVRRKRIALIGLRGAGKSTLGAALAKLMRRPFIELDGEIEREAGMALSEIFLLYGEPGYRGLERLCLDRIVGTQSDVVLTVGGGIVSEADSYKTLLSRCFCVWIKASPTEHMSRVIAQRDLRPMRGHAQAMDDLKAILTAREPLYARADTVVDTSGQSVAKSVAALRQAILTPSA
jgi:XRE family transcriptional regulator, aerobic/anaerobic benzoate catabolism transcriptional regulator